MKGCILMNRIKSFCKGVDQINSLLIKKKNIEILCQSMTFSVLELQRGYIYQLYQNWLTEDETVVTLEGSDPKELIKKFFDPVGDIFAGIEMILQV